MRALFDGDRVLVRVSGIDRRGRREAALVEVLEHKTHQVVGRYQEEHGIAYVIPENKRISQDIIIPPDARGTAINGQIVTAAITTQPSLHKRAIGQIVEVLGEHMAPGMEIDIAVRAHSLPHTWPNEVLEESMHFGTVPLGQKTIEGREDLRQLPLVTIDGEDAADFDDAVYCEKRRQGGWRLIVAIADVSYYVRPRTALDTEAAKRGNSVYFPGFVIPMLPEILANDLCSLKPKVERFCLACDMQINTEGKVNRFRFYPAIIQSHARFTYNRVASLLKNKSEQLPTSEELSLLPHLLNLNELYQVLRKTRETRGAIDFDTIETRVIFGEHRKIEQIVPVQRNDAHKIIEECMLCANVTAARFLAQHEIPALYRIHEGPTPEKLNDLRDFLSEFGLNLKGGKDPKPKDYASLLKSINSRPDAHLIQTVLLRSLRQAVYSPTNEGHFGLAYSEYTHFTSPIRRYPDLLIHRAIRHILTKEDQENVPPDITTLIQIGDQCSLTERRADEATRDAMDTLKCEYMLDRVGQEFPGIISAVTGFGLFVELSNVYIDGLVHVTTLKNDYYLFDPVKHRLTGQRTGVRFRLGDKVLVRVTRVSLDDKKIDLEMVMGSGTPKKSVKKQPVPTKKKSLIKKTVKKKVNKKK
jgi:ribonuclease R